MKVLVAYASKSGSTKGIAEFIGKKLRGLGLDAEVSDVSQVGDAGAYDAFVIGSAVFMWHWMKEARSFISKNRAVLSERPVWLFSSGPVGSKPTDEKGRDLLEVSGPSELEELKQMSNPRDHRVFFGALFPEQLTGTVGFLYNMARRSRTARESMPEGDFRDWKQIEAWASFIADTLVPAQRAATGRNQA